VQAPFTALAHGSFGLCSLSLSLSLSLSPSIPPSLSVSRTRAHTHTNTNTHTQTCTHTQTQKHHTNISPKLIEITHKAQIGRHEQSTAIVARTRSARTRKQRPRHLLQNLPGIVAYPPSGRRPRLQRPLQESVRDGATNCSAWRQFSKVSVLVHSLGKGNVEGTFENLCLKRRRAGLFRV